MLGQEIHACHIQRAISPGDGNLLPPWEESAFLGVLTERGGGGSKYVIETNAISPGKPRVFMVLD